MASFAARGTPRAFSCASVALAWWSSGCIISDPCDAHQVGTSGAYVLCVCEPGAVENPNGVGCTPCGEHESPVEGACVCDEGFIREANAGACVKSDVGAACSAELPCAGDYPYCAESAAGEGYCTSSDCSSNSACPLSWSCEEASGDRYCAKPPSGIGVACQSGADCEAYEAKYCEVFMSHTCFLEGCVGDTRCPNEWGCCDYAALFGSPLSICMQAKDLVSGACPMGGKLVSP